MVCILQATGPPIARIKVQGAEAQPLEEMDVVEEMLDVVEVQGRGAVGRARRKSDFAHEKLRTKFKGIKNFQHA